MPSFNVTARENGHTSVRVVVADTADNARLVAEAGGSEVIGRPVLVTHPVAGDDEATATEDEWRVRLGSAAMRLVVIGVIFPPLCWVGLVLGAVADTRLGRAAYWIGLCVIPLQLFA